MHFAHFDHRCRKKEIKIFMDKEVLVKSFDSAFQIAEHFGSHKAILVCLLNRSLSLIPNEKPLVID